MVPKRTLWPLECSNKSSWFICGPYNGWSILLGSLTGPIKGYIFVTERCIRAPWAIYRFIWATQVLIVQPGSRSWWLWPFRGSCELLSFYMSHYRIHMGHSKATRIRWQGFPDSYGPFLHHKGHSGVYKSYYGIQMGHSEVHLSNFSFYMSHWKGSVGILGTCSGYFGFKGSFLGSCWLNLGLNRHGPLMVTKRFLSPTHCNQRKTERERER